MNSLTTLKEEARAEFDKEFPCINTSCDNNGSIPHQVYEDEWEAEQCQYCFEVRFPQLASIEKNIDRTYHATKEEVRGEVRKIKTWVFTAPYGLEMGDGVVVPRKRTDDEYVKVSELRAALEDTTTSLTVS